LDPFTVSYHPSLICISAARGRGAGRQL